MINNKKYFTQKLQEGEACEKDFAEWLTSRGWNATITEGNFHQYDILAERDGISIKFEVKYNSGIEKYGTAFMECYQSGYPSALLTTEADWIIHYSETKEVRGMRTDDIIQYIEDNNLPLSNTKMKTRGGYVSGSGYRIKWDDLTPIK